MTNTHNSAFLPGACIQGVFLLSLNLSPELCTFVAPPTWSVLPPHVWLFTFTVSVQMLTLREPFLL